MRNSHSTRTCFALGLLIVAAATLSVPATAEDWPEWRGPYRNGTSPETGLISSWSTGGENLIWRADFTGRSTPVVFDGRVCANGRVGEGITRQEMVACFDAETGEKIWEHRFNVYNTSVPWNRVGWANVTGDPETGYLYVQGVGGWFFCFDTRNGEVVWSHSFIEEFGFMEGYGGRTQTATVDEDRVVITFSNTSWGPEGRPLHRIRAFDKRTGEQLWVSQPANSQADKNTQSTPSVTVIDGRRQVVAGNGGGGIYGVEARTGVPIWGFQLSKRGINTSVVVDGARVYGSHSEENVDEGTMGRVVAIDASGSGDVTGTHELWRVPLGVGFSSAALADGRLYVLDNSANLHALDAETGEHLWELNIGRVGKASPVVADGKIYITEVNGRFAIVGLGEEGGEILDIEEIRTPDGRLAEIYGSAAIAYGRIYFTTEEGIYCLGDKEREYAVSPSAPLVLAEEGEPGTVPATLRVTPSDVILGPGEDLLLEVAAFDDHGRPIPTKPAVDWSLDGLEGDLEGPLYRSPATGGSQTGLVVASRGELTGAARVRVLQDLPLFEDFEDAEVGSRPEYQMAYVGRFAVEELDGSKVLAKGPSPVKIHRHISFFGAPRLSDYTIQADLKGTRTGRKVPDMGLINGGYTMELIGAYQTLQVRSWQSELRMMQEKEFPWEPDTWYVMKLTVAQEDGKAVVRGKVWPRGEDEPADWSITVEDPLPIPFGAPGISGYSPSPIYFDNLRITSN